MNIFYSVIERKAFVSWKTNSGAQILLIYENLNFPHYLCFFFLLLKRKQLNNNDRQHDFFYPLPIFFLIQRLIFLSFLLHICLFILFHNLMSSRDEF